MSACHSVPTGSTCDALTISALPSVRRSARSSVQMNFRVPSGRIVIVFSIDRIPYSNSNTLRRINCDLALLALRSRQVQINLDRLALGVEHFGEFDALGASGYQIYRVHYLSSNPLILFYSKLNFLLGAMSTIAASGCAFGAACILVDLPT